MAGVKALGGIAFKFVSPGNAGVPDRMVILPGGIILFAELKATRGVLSKIQKYQIARLERMGASVQLVQGEKGVTRFLRVCAEQLTRRVAISNEIYTAQLPAIRD